MSLYQSPVTTSIEEHLKKAEAKVEATSFEEIASASQSYMIAKGALVEAERELELAKASLSKKEAIVADKAKNLAHAQERLRHVAKSL